MNGQRVAEVARVERAGFGEARSGNPRLGDVPGLHLRLLKLWGICGDLSFQTTFAIALQRPLTEARRWHL